MEIKGYELKGYKPEFTIGTFKPPITTIYIGKDTGAQIGVDKKFNWFQKKMIKWCFGFDVKENNDETN